ncbi:MAG: NUDIX domain-containing protein [bacterium]|nr:NUDIX domain-containing protein [bacterium]
MAFDDELLGLRDTLRAEGFVLNERTFSATRAFFLRSEEDEAFRHSLTALAPDLNLEEFVLNLTDSGLPVRGDDAVRAEYTALCEERPEFASWFREEPGLDGTTLLVARWLAHLVGFRHYAVHIFLDHPTLDDHTFVQLRSFDKCGYPGCFDSPVGGHIKGLQSMDDAVRAEVEEELGLDVDADTHGLVQFASCEHVDPDTRPEFRDVEYRLLFAGRLREGALTRCRFPDGEVAALCQFALHELDTLVSRHPDRVASGLLGSYDLYRDFKRRATS